MNAASRIGRRLAASADAQWLSQIDLAQVQAGGDGEAGFGFGSAGGLQVECGAATLPTAWDGVPFLLQRKRSGRKRECLVRLWVMTSWGCSRDD
jgi:hypothetical protein